MLNKRRDVFERRSNLSQLAGRIWNESTSDRRKCRRLRPDPDRLDAGLGDRQRFRHGAGRRRGRGRLPAAPAGQRQRGRLVRHGPLGGPRPPPPPLLGAISLETAFDRSSPARPARDRRIG
ncbi:unnamed protein product [Pieris brassicae]|uniref:Uncharacterized protein n=1 Tax=Pieris brassicae TaxID=7116 RepID=A0A9P0TLN3_PIEBR|nr:unnamed protein product [Pieris brassicae]